MVVAVNHKHSTKILRLLDSKGEFLYALDYDRPAFARVFGVDLHNIDSITRLDNIVANLVHGNDSNLWWIFVRTAESYQVQQENHNKELSLDKLTGAHNGVGLDAWVQGRLPSSKDIVPDVDGHEPAFNLTFIFIDLVNFKRINDDLSYLIGNEVIASAVSQLRRLLRKNDDTLVIRFSGDEFGIAIANLPEEVGWRIMRSIHNQQLEKIKERRNISSWTKIYKLKARSPLNSEIEIKTVDESGFDLRLSEAKKAIFISGERAVDVDDLAVMSAGIAHGDVYTKKDATELIRLAEANMKEIKQKYHQYMGGAYRK